MTQMKTSFGMRLENKIIETLDDKVLSFDEAEDLLRMLLNFTAHIQLSLGLNDDLLVRELKKYTANARQNIK